MLHCPHLFLSVAATMMIKLIVEYVMPSIYLLVSRFTICPLLLVSTFMNPDHNSSSSTPSDDELGTHSGCVTDYTCENASCHRAFHSLCLRDWLRSITTTRQYVEMGFPKMHWPMPSSDYFSSQVFCFSAAGCMMFCSGTARTAATLLPWRSLTAKLVGWRLWRLS
jgi:hypothetical protein